MGSAPWVLRVGASSFADEVRRRLGDVPVYVAPTADGRGRATAGHPGRGLIVATVGESAAALRDRLHRQGLEVRDGGWDIPDEPAEAGLLERLHICAVGYVSAEGAAGVWVDVDEAEAFEGEVLRRMFDEFCDTGEVRDTDYDAFLRAARPTCVVVDPEQIRYFLRLRRSGPGDEVSGA